MSAGPRKPQSRNIVGQRVREARKRYSPPLTQDQLSGKLSSEGIQLDRVAIAKIETGIRSVYDFEVCGLARALKVEPAWLLGSESGVSGGKVRSVRSRKPGI